MVDTVPCLPRARPRIFQCELKNYPVPGCAWGAPYMASRVVRPAAPEAPRDRVLTDDELKVLWKVTDDWRKGQFSRIVRLLLVTGLRRDEVGELQWGEIGSERITIGAARMKGGIGHEVPLTSTIKLLLPERPKGVDARAFVFSRSKTGFSGWSKAKERLDKRWRRPWARTQSITGRDTTCAGRSGIPPHVVDACLAHVVQGVSGVYNHALYREPKAQALNVWVGLLAKMVE